MPLTLTFTDGVFPDGTEAIAVQRLTESLLKWHGLSDNALLIPNVSAQVHRLAKASTFSGGRPFDGVWVEWKVPSFVLADHNIRRNFFEDITSVVQELTQGKQPREHIFINVVHAVDGGWSLDGRAVTNAELVDAIANA
jgi:hypothetical protein